MTVSSLETLSTKSVSKAIPVSKVPSPINLEASTLPVTTKPVVSFVSWRVLAVTLPNPDISSKVITKLSIFADTISILDELSTRFAFIVSILDELSDMSAIATSILEELSPRFAITVSNLETLSTKSVSNAIPVSNVPSPINLEASILPVATKPVVSFVSWRVLAVTLPNPDISSKVITKLSIFADTISILDELSIRFVFIVSILDELSMRSSDTIAILDELSAITVSNLETLSTKSVSNATPVSNVPSPINLEASILPVATKPVVSFVSWRTSAVTFPNPAISSKVITKLSIFADTISILDELSTRSVITVSNLETLSTKSVSNAIPVSNVPSPINLEASTLPVATKPVVSFVSWSVLAVTLPNPDMSSKVITKLSIFADTISILDELSIRFVFMMSILDELSPISTIAVSNLETLSTKSVFNAIPVSNVPSPINLEASTLPVATKPVVSFVSWSVLAVTFPNPDISSKVITKLSIFADTISIRDELSARFVFITSILEELSIRSVDTASILEELSIRSVDIVSILEELSSRSVITASNLETLSTKSVSNAIPVSNVPSPINLEASILPVATKPVTSFVSWSTSVVTLPKPAISSKVITKLSIFADTISILDELSARFVFISSILDAFELISFLISKIKFDWTPLAFSNATIRAAFDVRSLDKATPVSLVPSP